MSPSSQASPRGSGTATLDAQVLAFLRASRLLRSRDAARITPLSGGVSSDIWKIQADDHVFVVKRAVPVLKVATLWQADPHRSQREVDYLKWLEGVAPGWGPRVLAHDPERCLMAMEWLPPGEFALWKTELLAGSIDPGFAGRVGHRLAHLHHLSSTDPGLADRFGDLSFFRDLRLDAFLFETGRKHADLAATLENVAASLIAHRFALVHGDVSPKNILIGPAGPVLLDAEVATWCDPAFDLGFCLTHLALKALSLPAHTEILLASFSRLAHEYLSEVSWEMPSALEARAARLVPALMLARVDGKSPVEYLRAESDKARVRAVSRQLITGPRDRLEEIVATLRQSVNAQ